MSLRSSLKNLIRRDPAASLRERAADLQADLARVVRQPAAPVSEPDITSDPRDAELLALQPEWEALADAYARALEKQAVVSDNASAVEAPPPREPSQRWERLIPGWRERTGVAAAEADAADAMDDLCEIEDRISMMPATTLAGLQLKARVAQRNEDIDWPDGLGDGLVQDILAIGEPAIEADADLIRLGQRFEAARKRETAACEACNAAQDEADQHMPERPAALLFRASDHPMRLGKFLTHPDHLEGEEVTADDVAWMKRKPYVREVRRPVRPEDNLPADARTVVDTFPWPEAQERADEIVTAWDAWHTEQLRIHGEYVTAALDDAANEAGKAAEALVQRIADLPARTAEGFRVKLRALTHYRPDLMRKGLPDLPDPEHILADSLRRDIQDEAVVEPIRAPTPAVEPSPVFATIADGTRSAADDALSDARVSSALRKAVEAHRDATVAMLLEPDLSDEVSDARCAVVAQTGDALRAVQARSLADVRCKLTLLLPEILPDVNGSTPTAFLENIREDVDRLAQQSVPAPIGTSLVGQIDFTSGSMEDLRSLRDIANAVSDVAYAMAWTGRCHTRAGGEQHNAAGKLMQWLGEALTDVADEARKEARRRRPKTPDERETRLTILAGPTIENGDPDEIAAFAGELLAHAAAELAGR